MILKWIAEPPVGAGWICASNLLPDCRKQQSLNCEDWPLHLLHIQGMLLILSFDSNGSFSVLAKNIRPKFC